MNRDALADRVAFFGPLALYLATLVPTIHLGDSGELTLGAALLAIPHVPGYPLLALLGRAVAQTPLAHLAWRANFFSALCGAGAVWATWRLLFALTGRRAAALTAALVFACTFTLWEQSLKIRAYPLNTFFAALVLLLAWRWRQTFDRRWLWSAALAFGLGLGNHEILLVVVFVPAAWMIAERRRLRWRDVAIAAGFAAAGLSVYLYLPLRAAAGPALNWGDPSNLPRLLDVLLQKQYAAKMLNADWGAKLGVLRIVAASFVDELGPVPFVVGCLGLALLARRDRPLALGLLLLIAANVLLRINYIGPDESFQVRRYMISSYLVPIVGLAVFLAELQRRVEAAPSRWARPALAATCLLLVAAPAVRHCRANRQAGNWVGYEAWQNALSHPEPAYALFAGGDNSVFPLWYLQLGERRRPTVAILPYEGFHAPWVVAMMTRALPPGMVRPRPEFQRGDLANPLFLSTLANLAEQDALPVALTFETVGDPPLDAALAALRARHDAVRAGALCWLRDESPARDAYVWRFYEAAAIRDTALVRDHHTDTLAVKYAVHYDRLARAREEAGDAPGAIRAYRSALQADPRSDVVLAHLGNLLARLGNFDAAILAYQKAIDLAPGEKRHHRNLAVIYEAAGQPADAARERKLAAGPE
jgi:tetratricopeptide (TPR) repeat protein